MRDDTSATPWWFGWCVSRCVGVAVVFLAQATVGNDPVYYMSSLAQVGDRGWAQVLPEYPLPLVIVVWPLHLVVDLGPPPGVVVLLALLVVDLGFCLALHRHLGPLAVRCWVWGVLLTGPIALQRLDLVPGVLLALSVLAAGPVAAGGLLALGTAAKVFPITGLPAALASAARPLAVVVSTAAVGGASAALSIAVGGWDRLLSPLTYQSSRGLQIESVAATPVMLARLGDLDRWPTTYAASKSFEIAGPGTGLALDVTPMAQVVVVLVVVWLVVHTRRQLRGVVRSTLDPAALRTTVAWSTLAVLCGLIVTSRVFSPQYLLWLLPLVAVVAASPHRTAHAWSRRWVAAFLAMLVLSQALYPSLYAGVTTDGGHPLVATVVLVLRNLLLVTLTLGAFGLAFGAARAARGSGRLHLEAAHPDAPPTHEP